MFDINKEFNILILESDIEIEKAYSDLCFHNTSIFIESEQKSSINNFKNNYKEYVNRMISAFKAFINRCVGTIKDLYYKLKEKINEVIIQRKLNKLADFSKTVAIAKKQGKTSFQCIDIDKVVSLLKEESKVYKKEINSFCYNYINDIKTPDKAEQDIQRIEMKMESYTNKLHNLLETPRIYSINDAEKIVSKLTKDKEYIEVLNNYTKEIRDIEKFTVNVTKSIDNYREENGLNELSGIQKCITKSILFLRDHTFDVVKKINENLFIITALIQGPVNGFSAVINYPGDPTQIDDEVKKQITKQAVAGAMRSAATNQMVGTSINMAYDNLYGKKKEQDRIEDISKIYQSPSLKFR